MALCDSGNLSNTNLCDYDTFTQAFQAESEQDTLLVMAFDHPLWGAGSSQLSIIGQVRIPLTMKGVWPCWQTKMVLV